MSNPMVDPVAVLLKFAFIGVLYLFLLWVVRSALKDLRRPAPASGANDRDRGVPAPVGRSLLVVEGGGGLRAGASFVVDSGKTIGRAPGADIQIDDRFASAHHARIYERDGYAYIEDMGSTNGTYLNGQRLASEELLRSQDRVRIGDTEFRYEQQG